MITIKKMRDPAQVAHILCNSFKSLFCPLKTKFACWMPILKKSLKRQK
jgi:hypothetical protein